MNKINLKWKEFETLHENQEIKMVKGGIYKMFGIYKTNRSQWTLTHTPTKLKICDFKSIIMAKQKIAKLLEASTKIGLNWDVQTIEELKSQPSFFNNAEKLVDFLHSSDETELV